MTATTGQATGGEGEAPTELPEPRAGAHWRWATPRRALLTGGALVAGGAMAAGLGLGVAAATSSSTSTPSTDVPGGAHAPTGNGSSRPTVGGRITALDGDDIVVQTRDTTRTTVVYSSATTFEAISGPNGATTTSSGAELKVGAFIGVEGTKNADGTVTASSVTIGGPPSGAKGGPPPAAGERPGTGAPAGAPAPSGSASA